MIKNDFPNLYFTNSQKSTVFGDFFHFWEFPNLAFKFGNFFQIWEFPNFIFPKMARFWDDKK
jgi:hypothetical protein